MWRADAFPFVEGSRNTDGAARGCAETRPAPIEGRQAEQARGGADMEKVGNLAEKDSARAAELIDVVGVGFAPGRRDVIGLRVATDMDEGAKEALAAEMRRLKPHIIAELERREREKAAAEEERRSRIAAIDGLEDIRRAMDERALWREELENAYESEGEPVDAVYAREPKADIDAMLHEHPRAAAYLKAESYSMSEHYVKSRLGRDAMERIIEGDDCSAVVEKMDREWTDYCMAHAWD